MTYATPEQKGISSEHLLEYILYLEQNQMSMHDVIIMRGNDVVFEKYWAPFHKDFLHRQYSVSKSFVSLAIGFLEQDGLVNLDDPISKYFPEELKDQKNEYMRNQTVRHMLMMSTSMRCRNWFAEKPDDRVRFYFENDNYESRPSGTIFQYDSEGSFVLGALVERQTGKMLMEYLREKLFDKIGVSKEAYALKCPGGHTWGDSAVMCTGMDLVKVARFTMNGGSWDGQQLLNEAYVRDAVSNQIDNNLLGIPNFDTNGYGYLIWRGPRNSYFFNGMGCQLAFCIPDKDLIFVCNADNQGKIRAKNIIIDGFFDMVVNRMTEDVLPENPAAQQALEDATRDLKLAVAVGEMESEWMEKVDGVTYELKKNPMGIRKIRLDFDPENHTGILSYTNAQGDKKLPFGFGKNVFSSFPQEGYADEVGTVATKNFYYDCAVSAAWTEPNRLFLKVQIIDKYFGTLNMTFGFRDDLVGIQMNKCAEDFLDEYEGLAGGKACR